MTKNRAPSGFTQSQPQVPAQTSWPGPQAGTSSFLDTNTFTGKYAEEIRNAKPLLSSSGGCTIYEDHVNGARVFVTNGKDFTTRGSITGGKIVNLRGCSALVSGHMTGTHFEVEEGAGPVIIRGACTDGTIDANSLVTISGNLTGTEVKGAVPPEVFGHVTGPLGISTSRFRGTRGTHQQYTAPWNTRGAQMFMEQPAGVATSSSNLFSFEPSARQSQQKLPVGNPEDDEELRTRRKHAMPMGSMMTNAGDSHIGGDVVIGSSMKVNGKTIIQPNSYLIIDTEAKLESGDKGMDGGGLWIRGESHVTGPVELTGLIVERGSTPSFDGNVAVNGDVYAGGDFKVRGGFSCHTLTGPGQPILEAATFDVPGREFASSTGNHIPSGVRGHVISRREAHGGTLSTHYGRTMRFGQPHEEEEDDDGDEVNFMTQGLAANFEPDLGGGHSGTWPSH